MGVAVVTENGDSDNKKTIKSKMKNKAKESNYHENKMRIPKVGDDFWSCHDDINDDDITSLPQTQHETVHTSPLEDSSPDHNITSTTSSITNSTETTATMNNSNASVINNNTIPSTSLFQE